MSSISGIKMLINLQSHPCSSHYSRPFHDSLANNQPRLYSTHCRDIHKRILPPNRQTKHPTTFLHDVLFIATWQLLLGIMSTQRIKLDHGHSRGEKFSFKNFLFYLNRNLYVKLYKVESRDSWKVQLNTRTLYGQLGKTLPMAEFWLVYIVYMTILRASNI